MMILAILPQKKVDLGGFDPAYLKCSREVRSDNCTFLGKDDFLRKACKRRVPKMKSIVSNI
jgi:hypothetical protein